MYGMYNMRDAVPAYRKPLRITIFQPSHNVFSR